MQTSESTKQLYSALFRAQATIGGAVKSRENTHFRNRYADLASVMEAAKGPLQEAGLLLLQPAPGWQQDGGVVEVKTLIAHPESGEWISETTSAPVAKQDAQGMASAITYLRRIALASLLAIPQVDDDGNGATGAAPQPPAALAEASKAAAQEAEVWLVRIRKAEPTAENGKLLRDGILKQYTTAAGTSVPKSILSAWTEKFGAVVGGSGSAGQTGAKA